MTEELLNVDFAMTAQNENVPNRHGSEEELIDNKSEQKKAALKSEDCDIVNGYEEEATTMEKGFIVEEEHGGKMRKTMMVSSLRSSNRVVDNSILAFSGVNVVVGKGAKRKKLLSDVDGTVECGCVLAILGPSGAGKTILINALSLDAFGMTVTGNVLLNGKPINQTTFKRYCYVVKQQDKHWPYLTCCETLMYAAELYNIAAKKDIPSVVDEVILKMGLAACRDTKCGRLSGGQKRRLSIGIALLKQPTVLFFDEPTSGLDAAAASYIVQEIRRVARDEKLIIVCTIHQPSTKIFNGFDQVMILSKGREAFVGHVSEAEGYFASIGYPMPRATNPAEFFLDLVNADFSDDDEVDRILDEWEEYKIQHRLKETQKEVVEKRENRQSIVNQGVTTDNYATVGISIRTEIPIMFRRHGKLVIRDPVLFLGRTLFYLVSNICFSIVYLKARPFEQDQTMNKLWITIWFIGVPTNMGVVAVYALSDEFKSIWSEVRNGMVSPLSYVLAKSTLVLPTMLFFSVFALSISGYAIMAVEPSSYFNVIAIWAVTMFVFECITEALSVWFDNAIIGMLNYMNIWFASFLFGGFLIPYDDMFWPFKAFYYVMPFAYSVRSIVYAQFIDAKWEPCTQDPTSPGASAVCVNSTDGADVLDALGRVYPLITSENSIARDTGIMVALALCFKVIYIAGLIFKTGRVALIKLPLS